MQPASWFKPAHDRPQKFTDGSQCTCFITITCDLCAEITHCICTTATPLHTITYPLPYHPIKPSCHFPALETVPSGLFVTSLWQAKQWAVEACLGQLISVAKRETRERPWDPRTGV
ncbi:hypothetical protein H8959_022256 [Pygathrix nigripes]